MPNRQPHRWMAKSPKKQNKHYQFRVTGDMIGSWKRPILERMPGIEQPRKQWRAGYAPGGEV